jgi:hypothetical protein
VEQTFWVFCQISGYFDRHSALPMWRVQEISEVR